MSKKEEKPIYFKVIEYIKKQVENGQLLKGDKIPTERQLVELLGIGRNSIREALKILDIIGIIDRRQGDGSYIREEFDNWFSESMSIAFMLSDTSKKEIFEFRNMIEVEIATLAAQRITDEEIEELKICYNKLSENNDQHVSAKHDKVFHSLLAKASKNMIIMNAYNAMDYMLDQFIYNIRADVFKHEGKELLLDIHKNIYDAVINRNSKQAREAMKKHMDVIKRYYN
jgi:GntR family transcriptional repressor for pyruvate dehydrogenase complex